MTTGPALPIQHEVPTSSHRALIAFSLILISLRVWYVYHLRVDQDEYQHLHTIWAIGSGQMIYRDVFDNHMPLFHLLCAPLMQWLGERTDIVIVMRLAVMPLFFAMLALVYAITRSLYKDKPAAAWAALLTGLIPVFLFTGTEFRPDQLWTVLWLAVLLVLIRGQLNASRCFFSGLLLGLTFAVSMKTVLMLSSLAAGTMVAWLAARHKPDFKNTFRRAGSLVAGLAVVPACILAWIASHGMLASFWYCVIGHNIRYAHDDSGLGLLRIAVFPAGLLLILWRSRMTFRTSKSSGIGLRRVFIIASGGIYFTILFSFWPVLNNETYLPGIATLMPPLAAFLTSFQWRTVLPVMFATTELIVVLIARPLRFRVPTEERELIGEVLKLTKPGEFVMDETGESIYRRRPFYLLMETLTRGALKRGEMTDTIPHDIVATGTLVVVGSGQYPPATCAFLGQNFLPMGHLLIAGRVLSRDPAVSRTIQCDIAVPAKYALNTLHGEFRGSLDGTPYTGPRFLTVGPHELIPDRRVGIITAVWDRAIEQGFTYPLQ